MASIGCKTYPKDIVSWGLPIVNVMIRQSYDENVEGDKFVYGGWGPPLITMDHTADTCFCGVTLRNVKLKTGRALHGRAQYLGVTYCCSARCAEIDVVLSFSRYNYMHFSVERQSMEPRVDGVCNIHQYTSPPYDGGMQQWWYEFSTPDERTVTAAVAPHSYDTCGLSIHRWYDMEHDLSMLARRYHLDYDAFTGVRELCTNRAKAVYTRNADPDLLRNASESVLAAWFDYQYHGRWRHAVLSAMTGLELDSPEASSESAERVCAQAQTVRQSFVNFARGVHLAQDIEAENRAMVMSAAKLASPSEEKYAAGVRVYCDVCRFMVKAEGHAERCRVKSPVTETDRRAAWLGDALHALDVRRVVLMAGVPAASLQPVAQKYIGAAGQKKYVQLLTPELFVSDVSESRWATAFEVDYTDKLREDYIEWLVGELRLVALENGVRQVDFDRSAARAFPWLCDDGSFDDSL